MLCVMHASSAALDPAGPSSSPSNKSGSARCISTKNRRAAESLPTTCRYRSQPGSSRCFESFTSAANAFNRRSRSSFRIAPKHAANGCGFPDRHRAKRRQAPDESRFPSGSTCGWRPRQLEPIVTQLLDQLPDGIVSGTTCAGSFAADRFSVAGSSAAIARIAALQAAIKAAIVNRFRKIRRERITQPMKIPQETHPTNEW